jgi:integral membrane protein
MIRFFRMVALFEGLTTLALFLVAMPLKYGFDNPVLVPPVGMLHGVAFLLYVATMVVTLPTRGFSALGWLRTSLASLVPFGTFLNDPYLRGRQLAHAARRAGGTG